MKNSFLYTTNRASLPDIQLTTGPIQPAIADSLRQQTNVRLVYTQGGETARWAIPSGHFPLNVVGVKDFNAMPFNPVQLLEGHFPATNEIVLESSDRAVSPVHVGDKITVVVHGADQKLTVSGFVRTQGLPSATLLSMGRGYMREGNLETFFQLSGVNQFLVRLDKPQNAYETSQQLVNTLNAQHIIVLNSRVGQNLVSNSAKTDSLFSIIGAISIVALVLSVFLLISTMSALLTEQFPIIGTMKAIGARHSQIMLNYLTTVAFYSIIGTLIGIGLGLWAGYQITAFVGSLLTLDAGPLSLDPSTLLISLLVGLGVPLLAALLPIYLGTRITVQQALAGYGLERDNGNPGELARIFEKFFAFLPQVIQLGIRSLFRKRTRMVLTLMGLAVTGAVLLMVLTGIASLSADVDGLVHIYRFDVVAAISQPVSVGQVHQALIGVQGIKLSEETTSALVHTTWGNTKLTGMPANTQVYQKHLVAGRWFTNDDQHVLVINRRLADLSGLTVGDTLAFHNDLYSASWQIIGIVMDDNNVSAGSAGVVFTTVTQVNTFKHVPQDFVDTIDIQATTQNAGAIDTLATNVDTAFSLANIQSTVQTLQQVAQATRSEVQLLSALLFIATAIVALVGAMSILERQREIGILRSMGATGKKIAQVFWTEGTTLGVLSWLVVLLLGFPLSYGFVKLLGTILAPLPFTFDPLNLLWMLAFVIAVASLASVGPALGAARIKIAQTLRYQ